MTAERIVVDHTNELRKLSDKVDQLSNDVHDLVDAWNTAKGLVRLVKLMGALSASFAAAWALLKMGVLHGSAVK